MITLPTKITATLIAIAAAGGALTTAAVAQADAAVRDDRPRAASVADETPDRARGSITFRGERYTLSDRAVVSTSPTTIRIVDDSATSLQGTRTGVYVQFGYTLDASKPTIIRVTSGIAIRGYDFANGTYSGDQAVHLGLSALSIDSPHWSEATHTWGHLNSTTERGIELDVHGVHFGSPS